MKCLVTILVLISSCSAQNKWYDYYSKGLDSTIAIQQKSGFLTHNYFQNNVPVAEATIWKYFKENSAYSKDADRASLITNTGTWTLLAGIFTLGWPLGWNLTSNKKEQLEYKY